jgi:hypothetical protein
MATSATLRNVTWMDGITFASQDARLATVSALLAAPRSCRAPPRWTRASTR